VKTDFGENLMRKPHQTQKWTPVLGKFDAQKRMMAE
jgi:hypothetical protein